MHSKSTNELIKSIAKKHGYTDKQVKDIVMASWHFLHKVMQNADRDKLEFPSVRIKHFGTFYCSDARKRYFKRLKLIRETKDYEQYNQRARNFEPIFTDTDRPDTTGDTTKGDETGGVPDAKEICQQDA